MPINRPPRRGTLTVELLFALPIALIVFLAMIEFCQLLMVQQQMTAASREGARVAALGGTAAEAEAAARQVLGTGSLAAADVAVTPGAESGGPVSAKVSILATQVVPDLLRYFAYSIQGDVLVAETTMRME
jgi:Flp pilus assembly protein TadG